MSLLPLRGATRLGKLALATLVISACVTINVYFPAAAAEKAADKIIDAVTGAAGGAAKPAPAPAAPPTGRLRHEHENPVVLVLGKVLYAIVPAAQAQESANLDISSPEIRAITSSSTVVFSA